MQNEKNINNEFLVTRSRRDRSWSNLRSDLSRLYLGLRSIALD